MKGMVKAFVAVVPHPWGPLNVMLAPARGCSTPTSGIAFDATSTTTATPDEREMASSRARIGSTGEG